MPAVWLPAGMDMMGGLFGLETEKIHATLYFGNIHEHLPNESGTVILDHQHGDTLVNTDHIR